MALKQDIASWRDGYSMKVLLSVIMAVTAPAVLPVCLMQVMLTGTCTILDRLDELMDLIERRG